MRVRREVCRGWLQPDDQKDPDGQKVEPSERLQDIILDRTENVPGLVWQQHPDRHEHTDHKKCAEEDGLVDDERLEHEAYQVRDVESLGQSLRSHVWFPYLNQSVVLAPDTQSKGQQEEQDPRANEDHWSTAGESAAGVLTQTGVALFGDPGGPSAGGR